VRRNRLIILLVIAGLLILLAVWLPDGHPATVAVPRDGTSTPARTPAAGPHTSPLDNSWQGNGQLVTLAFAGDVNFPSGSGLASRLATNPSTALGSGASQLLSGADLSMVNFESALTNGTCPQPQGKAYVFSTSAAAISAFRGAGVSLVSEANNHGEDCGPAGLQMALAIRSQTGYHILGIGQNATDAFAPYRVTIHDQRIAVIAATQVIDSDLQTAWTATPTQAGLASAYDVGELAAAVQTARKTADTVVVFLHWGVESQACPGPAQEPLADLLVKAGADIVVGAHAHVLLGGGFLGSAYVDYGLGNFAFYNDPPPTNRSGSLVISATGRHINSVTWRPALIEGELPVPLSGAAAADAIQSWSAARSCTGLSPARGAPLATAASEDSPPDPAAVARLSVVR
jgi:poly-gamma-glutamate synthesis protein (capsule biosynthesis protein)